MLLTNYLSNLEERAVLRRDERQLLRSMLILRLAQVKLQPFRGMSHPPTKKNFHSTLHNSRERSGSDVGPLPFGLSPAATQDFHSKSLNCKH